MLTAVLAALLAALVAGATAPPPTPLAVARVPDEESAIVLPDGTPTLQAVAADLDGDGVRDVVRLIAAENGTIWIEGWAEGGGEWREMGEPALAVPGDFEERPVRLIVRRVDGQERVTLVREDLGEPEHPECCLDLADLVIGRSAIEIVPVAETGAVADSIHVIDLDGDGTDELLAAFSLAPLNDASTSTEARVYRWAVDRFAPPTVTELPVGSGSTLFVLGDSDGVPGDEAAVISSSALDTLFRISLGPRDTLVAEDSGLFVDQALAVPLGDGDRGVALVFQEFGLEVRGWPRGEPIRPPIAVRRTLGSTLVGIVDVGGDPRLLVHRPEFDILHVLQLPFLGPLGTGPLAPSEAANALAGGPLEGYAGPLPGGGPDGQPAAIVDGRLLPGLTHGDPATPIGALAGSRPVGLVGPDRAWLVVQHSSEVMPEADPAGGPLRIPVYAGGALSIAPLTDAATPEGNGGAYDPPLAHAVALGDGVTGVGRAGMTAEVHAPRGSYVYLSTSNGTNTPTPDVVGENGQLDVDVTHTAATADSTAEVTMTVATPAGHAYVARWNLRLFEEAPRLSAQTTTPLGSGRVTVAGRTAEYAEVEVAGAVVAVDEEGRFTTSVDMPPWPTAVTVTARDPIGNEANVVVTGVGLFDYRRLPWIPIALVLLGAVAIGLILRVPTPRLAARPPSEDGALEELDPADRL